MSAPNGESHFLDLCLHEAETGLREGGIPIGAILVEHGEVVSTGRNRRVQDGDPLAHAEIEAIRHAGRRPAYDQITLYSSASPCLLCSGAIVHTGIARVVAVGYRYLPEARQFLESFGIKVVDLEHDGCLAILERFALEHPDLWQEDIGAHGRQLGRW